MKHPWEQVRWLVPDITKIELEPRADDLWHDRAVFHFLTEEEQRIAYVRQVARSVKPGGHIIISTFGAESPMKCSGLEVTRYDAESLQKGGACFRLMESSTAVMIAVFLSDIHELVSTVRNPIPV